MAIHFPCFTSPLSGLEDRRIHQLEKPPMRLIFLCALAIFTAVLPSEALAGKFEVIVQTGSLTGTSTLR